MNTGLQLPALPPIPGRLRWLIPVLAVALIPLGSLGLASGLGRYFQIYTPNMIFLCGVVLAAIWFGRTVALCTAVASFLIYNYSLMDPRNSLGLNGLNDLLTISVFLLVAFFIGTLAGTLRDERNRAREQVRTLSKLLSASQEMADCRDAEAVMRSLANASHQLQGDGVAVFALAASGPRIAHRIPAAIQPPTDVVNRAAALLESRAAPASETSSQWSVEKVIAAETTAVVAWRQPKGPYAAQQAIAAELLLSLAQAAFERTQTAARQVAMKTMETTDRLRTALLSSISHDFRTPLSTIIASASSLLTYGETFPERTRTDLLTSIQEEAERLSRFVGNVLDMTRLEAGVLKPRAEWTDPLELIENVRDRIAKRAQGRELEVNAPAVLPAIEIDPLLLEQALVNVLDNAIVHTPAGSNIEIGAQHAGGALKIWVEDTGNGVDAAELAQIFDKFYRPAGSSQTAGLGLGLAISKALVEAMHGQVHAASGSQAGRGLRIEFEFPSPTVSEAA